MSLIPDNLVKQISNGTSEIEAMSETLRRVENLLTQILDRLDARL